MPHPRLHIFTDLAKTLRDDADCNRDDWRDNNQNEGELPAIVEHHRKQTDDIGTFTNNGN